MLQEALHSLIELLTGPAEDSDHYYDTAIRSGFTDSDAKIFARIAFQNNFTADQVQKVISNYNSFTVASGSTGLRIWNALKILGGLSEIISWLEFPAAIDAIKKLKIDPITVQRALDKYAFNSLLSNSPNTMVKLSWQEVGNNKIWGTNLVLDTASGAILVVVVEATSEFELGELVGIGQAAVVADNVVMHSKIYKEGRTRDVYYQSDGGPWLITGPSTGSPELYPSA